MNTVILDLSALFTADGVLPFKFSFDLSGLDFSGEHPLSEIEVSGRVTSSASVVEMTGDAVFIYRGRCNRCAEDIEREMTVSFSHTLVSSKSNEQDDELIVVSGNEFEPDELIREDVILSLPVKFLCKDDCAGVCQRCGKNLNLGPCECPEKEPDERLAALAALLD